LIHTSVCQCTHPGKAVPANTTFHLPPSAPMLILWIKSALLSACSASRINAPMVVPLRSTCRDKTKSFFSRSRYFANLTTRNAKANDLSLTGFPSFSFLLTSQLVIRRFLAYRKSCKQPHYLIRGTGPPPDNPAIIHSQFSIINYSLYPLALRPSSALLH
jgi:hypothetical protein